MTLTDERPEPKTITDHAFLPSWRPDSCDWMTVEWTHCDLPQAAHALTLTVPEWLPGPSCTPSCGPAYHVDSRATP